MVWGQIMSQTKLPDNLHVIPTLGAHLAGAGKHAHGCDNGGPEEPH